MAKVITTELQHSGASGANITLDSSKNVTCENNLTVDGTTTLTGTVSLPDDTVTIADLAATGTASASTFLRGDNAWAAAGGGKVVAVKYAQTDTNYVIAKADSSWTDLTNANITHTPAATGNYVIAIANIKHEPSGNTGSNGGVRLYNHTGSTAITAGGIFDITQGTHERQATMTMGYHTPNSTSAISFRVQCSCWSASANTWSVGGSGGIGIQHFIIEVEPTS